MASLCRGLSALVLIQKHQARFTPCVTTVRHANWNQFSRWRKKYKQPIGRYKQKDNLAKIPPDAWAEPLYEHQEKVMRGEKIYPEKAAMLHMVQRIRPLRNELKTTKKIVEELGLGGPLHKPVVLKNTPEINRKLMEVKHLLTIKQIHFPYGPPESEADFDHTYLKSNGECIVQKDITPAEVPVKLETNEETRKWTMDGQTMKKHLAKKQNEFQVIEEYFEPSYKYKYNQDGKEFRYNFNKDPKMIEGHYNRGRPVKGRL